MEAKVVSSAGHSNRISKDHYKKVQSSLSKQRVHHAINESICGISKEINHLVSKSIIYTKTSSIHTKQHFTGNSAAVESNF